MPPRNSKTNTFAKYNHVSTVNESKKAYLRQEVDKLINNFPKISDYRNSDYAVQYRKYLEGCMTSGKSPNESFYKKDTDGDPRYVNKRWYQDRAKGKVGAWDYDDKSRITPELEQ